MHDFASIVQRDLFAKLLGVELLEVKPGYARTRLRLTQQHLNGVGIVQGGVTFTLADIAFAAACNSDPAANAVAVNCSINYCKPAKAGTLIAEASEVPGSGKLRTCNVRVTDEAGEVVAVFQGLAYRRGGAVTRAT